MASPCRGCGGPKDRIAAGVVYCNACAASHPAEWSGRMPKDKDRQARMAALYRAGKTLEQIGAVYSVTRERVRQIIRSAGVARADGGQSRQSADRREWKARKLRQKWDVRRLAVFGCSQAEFEAANDGVRYIKRGSPAMAYREQMRNAVSRGIEWRFTFPEWKRLWLDSGHFHERGRGGDLYVMSRYGDRGPYCTSNVYITTLRANSSDCQAHRRGRLPSYALNP